jgi:Fe-S cluster assembly iron-binding protein IscA
MNERIKELAEQAGYTKDMFGVGHWDMSECKKFAELIIRECMSYLEEGDIDFAKFMIKKHFGVEETSAQAEQEAAEFIAAEDKKVASRYGYFPKLHPSEWQD